MTADPRVQTLLTRIALPPQDLEQLTFCSGSKSAQVEQWVEALPLTRISYVSGLIYKALPEVARLKTSATNRLNMLETLRPAAQHCIQGLSQSFLNQPLILPEAALKTATVAQALQKHMTNAYLTAVRDFSLAGKQDGDLQDQQALAIHRALTGLGLLLLRSYQLYTPTPSRFWEEIHSLYLLAEALQVQHQEVEDTLPDHDQLDTPEKVYLRLLLLACARPNQLRQDEVNSTYAVLNELAPLAQLLPYNSAQNDNLFAVLLNSNRPPLYKSRLPNTQGEDVRELNTGKLVQTLNAQTPSKSSTDSASRNRYGLTSSLTQHLVSAWNFLAQRSFDRQGAEGKVELTIGLSNLHFHLCGGQAFNLFLNQSDDILGENEGSIFQRRGIALKETKGENDGDPWDSAFDVNPAKLVGNSSASINVEEEIRRRQQIEYSGQHPIYSIGMIDVSPGGYCLEWRSEIPTQVKAGEILGVREEGRTKWGIGVVRWVQQTQGATQLGIQILAPQASPIGAAVVYKTGGYSEYLRALQIPALKAINQPETLITNTVSFREYSKVRLYRPEGERTVQLTRRTFSTGAISQFTFRELVANKKESSDDDTQDFDSIWK